MVRGRERRGREVKNEMDFVLFVPFPFSKLIFFPLFFLGWSICTLGLNFGLPGYS